MDRLSQLRGEAGGSRDSTLDTTSPPSEAFMTANESSSKYYSLSEVDSTFDISAIKDDISSIKDVSLASTAEESEGTITNTDELISNLSPIGKKSDILDSYKIDTQIEAANILSGGVAIFDDNDNSYDGDELVIDDNVEVDEKSNSELKQPESLQFKSDENIVESSLNVNEEEAHIASKDTEVVLQIDGNQVDAIDIGNGLYLYRKQDHEELAAVQISTDDQQQPNFKFLKVRENAEGNLEVYEEIQVEVTKEVPAEEGKVAEKNTPSHVPIMDINKVISDTASNKVADRKVISPRTETTLTVEDESDNKESSPDKSEVNLNGKMMKFNESRKSPVIGSFTPMTYHSTPNKGVPLTKTMVDQQLHTNRHSDLSNVKKTIEVHTDGAKQKIIETPTKSKDTEDNKLNEGDDIETEGANAELNEKEIIENEEKSADINENKKSIDTAANSVKTNENKSDEKIAEVKVRDVIGKNEEKLVEQNIVTDVSKNVAEEKPQANLQLENLKHHKAQGNLSIVEEVSAQKEKEDAEARKNKDNNKVDETTVDGVMQIDDLIEGKDEPMEIDDDIELTIAENVPSVEESKEKVEDSNQNEIKDDKQVKVPEDNQEQNLVIVDEPMLIEDDDVTIVEEIIEDTKDEKINIPESIASDSKKDANLDTAASSKNLLKVNEDVQHDKLVIEESKDTVDTSIQPESKKDLCTMEVKEVKNDIMNTILAIEKETKNDGVASSLSVQTEPIKDTVHASSTSTLRKDLKTEKSQEESKKDLGKPSINELKISGQELSIVDHDTKTIDTVVTKDVPKETIKHNIPTNISPLLDQKHASLVASKVNKESSVAEEKLEPKKSSPNIQNVNKSIEHKEESKVLKTSVRKLPGNLVQITEPLLSVAQKRVDNNTVPQTVTPVVDKSKEPQKVDTTLEVSQKVDNILEVPQKVGSTVKEIQNVGSTTEISQNIINPVKELLKVATTVEKVGSTVDTLQNVDSTVGVSQKLGNTVKTLPKVGSTVEVSEKVGTTVKVPEKVGKIIEAKQKVDTPLTIAQKVGTPVEIAQNVGSTVEATQKVGKTVEMPLKVAKTVEVPIGVGKIVDVPQKVSSTVEPAQKVVSTVELPQKVVSAVEVPQKVGRTTEIPQKVGKTVEVPIRGSKIVDIPQKVSSTVEPPQKVGSTVEVPQKVGCHVEVAKRVLPPTVKNTSLDKPTFTLEPKRPYTSQKDDKKDIKLPPKDIVTEKARGVINLEITKVPKLDPTKTSVAIKQDASSSSSKHIIPVVKNRMETKDKRELPKVAEAKPINNNHAAAVPFGKWTEANRQEFLNKFKTKASVTSSNSNQLKNSNDLNRRDVLKKIDSQRQSSNALSKTQEANKLTMKPETAAFSNKPNVITKEVAPEPKILQKTETVEVKPKPVVSKNIGKVQVASKTQNVPSNTVTGTSASKKEVCQRTGVVQNLIDKTIEGMIHRSVPVPKTQDEPKQPTNKEPTASKPTKPQQTYPIEQATLDAIEMKMNELHGIPFIERPPHELPKVHKELKSYSKIEKEKPIPPPKTKIPNLLPFPNKIQPKLTKDTIIEVDSEDEIIEHEPITGDINLIKKNQVVKPPAKEKLPSNITQPIQQEKPANDPTKKDAIITEKDFDKFARRNSITYENCLTVNFDGKEPHNVVQTVVEKEIGAKSYSRNDAGRVETKAKLPYKYQNVRPNTQPAKAHPIIKFEAANDDVSNRNQSKLQKAYHSALTAKRQMAAEPPITIIEDKPVKVVFIDNADYVPSQLNVQGQDLSPAKRAIPESDLTVSTCDSLDSDMLDSIDDSKVQDDTKIKTKHQRKQVLTPVDEPELELIEPSDLGIEVSPKKKRKTDDDKTDRNLKYPMRKKIYMLSSSAVTEEKVVNPVEIIKNPLKETVNINDNGVAHKTVSALDSLVKAAELIETQTENMNTSIVSNPDNPSTTPVKRGRGRPRKYPLTPDGTVDKSKLNTPSPQKKPRLIDAKVPKRDIISDDSDSEGEIIIKENWTMGKINENIVCPICNKLFRTENVVFKHVKHCTGPSPSRSDSDKRSPRRTRISQDFDTKSRESKSDDMDMDDDKPLIQRKETPKKRKSKDSITKSDDKDDIIVIEDTPIKEKPEKVDERKHHESRKPKTKVPHKSNDLVCEFCGKTFRQLSYLVSHRLQHKKQEKVEPKKSEKEPSATNKSVYSCEVCKKEFRKLHHLVQHRIIHNPNSVPARSLRKSSSEQSESKIEKEPNTSKQSDDPSAGFRCEPCDKSFRKLHHLVEHRETHDGINRQKTTTATPTKEEKEKPVEKPVVLHQCDICKKTFKKLQLLNEHKEQHVETSSEKSDDKSVKSSLSTRDIIHECSLCYMVFPNEHSLNKHTIICQRKKRQSKQLKPTEEAEGGDEVIESPTPEEKVECTDTPMPIFENTKKEEKKLEVEEKVETSKDELMAKELEELAKSTEPIEVMEKEKHTQKLENKLSQQQVPPAKKSLDSETKSETISEVPEKITKIKEKEPVKIRVTPKKKTPVKDKIAIKRLVKAKITAPPVVEEIKPEEVESNDDDYEDPEALYMLNPNFKTVEEATEGEKVFLKVRANKRSSLQIERPNSKDLVKRRTSLQHPPKIPRLKPKAIEPNTTNIKKETKTPKLEPVPSTDSDDSETVNLYAFPPSPIPEKPIKPAQERTPKGSERKIQKKSLADKRKSLSGIAKRKSLGKGVTAKHKVTPLKPVKKRTLDAEHRCDCGQLFSSAALLSRHTTLAHTPPRIRRRRSPPPEEKPVVKPAPRKSSVAEKSKKSPAKRKSTARSDSNTSINNKSVVKKARKSQVKDAESPSDSQKAKPEKSEAKSSAKPKRTGAHRGVPVPEKMRKLMQKK